MMRFGKILPSRYFNVSHPVIHLDEVQFKALASFRNKLTAGVYDFEEAACLCGAIAGIQVASRDRYALPVNTVLCKSCGLLWTTPRMTKKSLQAFYDCDYRPLYVGSETATEAFFADQIHHGEAILAKIFHHMPWSGGSRGTVFDVGCGAGGVLVPFRDEGLSVYGCDYGARYLDYGRALGLTLEQGSFESLGKYGLADLLILSHVLEHFVAPLEEMKKISDLLRPGGFLYVEVPGVFRIHKTYRDPLLFFQNAHNYHFTLKGLTMFMAKAGFELVAGDEHIRALFRKGGDVSLVRDRYDYIKIVAYLLIAEMYRRFSFAITLDSGRI